MLPTRQGWKRLRFQCLAVSVGPMEGTGEGSSLFLCGYNSEVFGDVTFWVWLLLFLLLLCCNAAEVIFAREEAVVNSSIVLCALSSPPPPSPLCVYFPCNILLDMSFKSFFCQ